MKKRVLLKISGEALLGQKEYGIDNNVVDRIALEMKEAGSDTEIAVVVGGGNIFRGCCRRRKYFQRYAVI